MGNLAKNVLGIQQAAVQPELGTLTVRAPAASLWRLTKPWPICWTARARCCWM